MAEIYRSNRPKPSPGALHALSPDILIFYAPKTALKVIYLIPCCFLVRVKVWNARATTDARTEWSVATPASVGMLHAAPKRHERWTGVALCRSDRRRDFFLRTQRNPCGYSQWWELALKLQLFHFFNNDKALPACSIGSPKRNGNFSSKFTEIALKTRSARDDLLIHASLLTRLIILLRWSSLSTKFVASAN